MDHLLNRLYGFTRTPFGPVAGPEEVFPTRSQTKLVQDVVAELFAGSVVLTIRGGVGVGKTSLMHRLAEELQTHKLCVVQIDSSSQAPSQVLRLIAAERGIEEPGAVKPDQLFQRLRNAQAFDALVLIVDDADALSVAMFRYLELLTELNYVGMMNVHLVLIGGPGPWAGLVRAGLEGGRWAGATQHFVCALGQVEAVGYLDHKFRYAGRSLHQVMTKAAVAELIDQAAGVPAELDALASLVLEHSYRRGRKRITLKAVQQALMLDPVTASPFSGVSPAWVPATAATLSIIMAGAITLFVVRDGPAHDTRLASAAVFTANVPAAVASASAPTADSTGPVPPAPIQPAPIQAAPVQPAPVQTTPVQTALAATAASPPTQPPALDAAAATVPPSANAPTPATAVASALDRPAGQPYKPDPQPLAEGAPSATPDVKPSAAIASPDTPVQWPDRAMDQSPAGDVPAPTEPSVPRFAQEAWLRPPRSQASDVPAPMVDRKETAQTGAGNRGAPGLVLIAGAGDDLATLYARVYRGLTPPPYQLVAAVNRTPVKPGALVTFPEPPGGWSARASPRHEEPTEHRSPEGLAYQLLR
jgi:type II secretory pathway predicted ATPase ExeA